MRNTWEQEFERLMILVFDGREEASDRNKLDRLLADNLDALRSYVALIQVDSMLYCRPELGMLSEGSLAHTALMEGEDDDQLESVTPPILSVSDHAVSVPSERIQPALCDLRASSGWFSTDWLISYVVAGVIIGIALLFTWGINISHHQQQIAVGPSSLVPSADELDWEYVARITGMNECRWADPNSAPLIGSFVPLRRKYALTSGLMEITYKSGAKVILEGPCTFAVESDSGGFLESGKLTARIGGKGEGRGKSANVERNSKSTYLHSYKYSSFLPSPSVFVVKTPAAIIIDLGTEFGVEVDEHGGSYVSTFEGEVLVSAINGAKEEDAHLKAGQSGSISRDGKITVLASPPGERRFARKMSTKAPLVSLDGPSFPVAQWNIGEGAGYILYPEVSGELGIIRGKVTWRPDGPPAMPKTCLYFDGSADDYVAFRSGGSLSLASVTVALWAKADPNAAYSDMSMAAKYTDAPGSWELGWANPANGNKLFFRVWPGESSTYAYSSFNGSSFLDGKWHFFVGTYDQDSGTVALYVDGHLDGTASVAPGTSLTLTDHWVYLGRRGYLTKQSPYTGYLGGPFIIGNKAMSGEEVRNYYQRCLEANEKEMGKNPGISLQDINTPSSEIK